MSRGNGDVLARSKGRVRRLQAVVEASLLVNSTLDLEELARHIVGLATQLIGAERGSLFLVDGDAGRLRAMVAQGLDGGSLEVAIGDGIVGAVAATGEAIILDQPYADSRFDRRVDTATGFRTRSLLTVPVRGRDGELVAVLQLLNHRQGKFTTADVDFLADLGVTFAIALNAARMHRQIVERERLAEEVRLAAEIQRTLRPRSLRDVPGLNLESLVHPCREVGGDYFDVIPARGGKSWWLVMADISGKGVSAGLIASNVQAYLWTRRADRRSLTRIVAEGNDLLYGLTHGRKFATLLLAEWVPTRRAIRWVGAGHPPALLVRNGRVRRLDSTGRPIGMLPNQDYGSGSMQLRRDDLILLYTDGVTEATANGGDDEFGLLRLIDCLGGATGCRDALGRVAGALERHVNGHPFEDDVTLLCGRCTADGAGAVTRADAGLKEEATAP
ncbi:MAG: SpoIIE family protein phosphatase [Acidobacteria bacterium]|nr:SpoIIE family protein phosphatase [Acidobacteriota bacterium]